MKTNFDKGPLIMALLILIGTFIIVAVVRYLVIRDFDAGFSLIISVLVLFVYYIVFRLIRYIKNKEN